MTTASEPVDLFYSYAHEDQTERDELDAHLALLRRRGVIRTWHDRAIVPGESWRQKIDAHLESADVILFLVSSSFFASDFIWQTEMPRALARQTAGEAAVVPIIVKPVDLEDAPFGEIQTLPTDRKPVTTWPNRDEAWVDVVKGIRRAIERAPQRPAAAGPSDGATSTGVAPAAPPKDRPIPPPAPAPPGGPPLESTRTVAAAGAGPSRAYDHALAGFSEAVRSAYELRSLPAPAAEELRAVGDTLADVREPKRILWVDDHPENNRAESAALRRMQFDVQARRSTEEGLDALEREEEPYDLVISDWIRRPQRSPDEPEGLRLLRAIRAAGLRVPVVLYHAPLDPDALEERRRTVREAGGQLATYLPDELLAFVAETFGSSPG